MKKILSLLIALSFNQMIQAESPIDELYEPNHFEFVTFETTPYETATRKDYSLFKRSCGAVLISKNWAMTAKHCIKYKYSANPWKVKIGVIKEDGKYNYKRATNVIRHKSLDLALIKLDEPITNVEPVLLLSDIITKKDKHLKMKKIYRQHAWNNIPVRAGKRKNLYVSKPHRKGKAGTSGSPWVINSIAGDVLIGITHGSGRSPQIANATEWIKDTVNEYSTGESLYFITKKEMLRAFN